MKKALQATEKEKEEHNKGGVHQAQQNKSRNRKYNDILETNPRKTTDSLDMATRTITRHLSIEKAKHRDKETKNVNNEKIAIYRHMHYPTCDKSEARSIVSVSGRSVSRSQIIGVILTGRPPLRCMRKISALSKASARSACKRLAYRRRARK